MGAGGRKKKEKEEKKKDQKKPSDKTIRHRVLQTGCPMILQSVRRKRLPHHTQILPISPSEQKNSEL